MKSILLVDDDADDRMFFQDALKQASVNAHLTFASDGIELMDNLELVQDPPPPHVIFLDLNMPRKNGFDCLKEIRETPRLKNIPIVIFSTTDNQDAVNATYKAGANHYVCKPRSFKQLIKTIEKVLTLEMWAQPQPPKEKYMLTAN